MIESPSCPTCGAESFEAFGSRTYSTASIAKRSGWSQTALRILFELWVPGKSSFVATFVGCRSCGTMIYEPRPSDDDVSRKYEFVGTVGDSNPNTREKPGRALQRQKRIGKLTRQNLKQKVQLAKILDFGGGDGRLIQGLSVLGASCDVIDYCREPVSGVRHVGLTENDLPIDAEYDCIICSHVVEHLPSPLSTLRRLGKALAPDGFIYVEVPVEMIGKLPAGVEPVTHVNFFTPDSLAVLLENAGLGVRSSRLVNYPHPFGNQALCAGAIAVTDPRLRRKTAGFATLQAYLKPSVPLRLKVAMILWQNTLGRVARRLRK